MPAKARHIRSRDTLDDLFRLVIEPKQYCNKIFSYAKDCNNPVSIVESRVIFAFWGLGVLLCGHPAFETGFPSLPGFGEIGIALVATLHRQEIFLWKRKTRAMVKNPRRPTPMIKPYNEVARPDCERATIFTRRNLWNRQDFSLLIRM
jgi:hypothetical protein